MEGGSGGFPGWGKACFGRGPGGVFGCPGWRGGFGLVGQGWFAGVICLLTGSRGGGSNMTGFFFRAVRGVVAFPGCRAGGVGDDARRRPPDVVIVPGCSCAEGVIAGGGGATFAGGVLAGGVFRGGILRGATADFFIDAPAGLTVGVTTALLQDELFLAGGGTGGEILDSPPGGAVAASHWFGGPGTTHGSDPTLSRDVVCRFVPVQAGFVRSGQRGLGGWFPPQTPTHRAGGRGGGGHQNGMQSTHAGRKDVVGGSPGGGRALVGRVGGGRPRDRGVGVRAVGGRVRVGGWMSVGGEESNQEERV